MLDKQRYAIAHTEPPPREQDNLLASFPYWSPAARVRPQSQNDAAASRATKTGAAPSESVELTSHRRPGAELRTQPRTHPRCPVASQALPEQLRQTDDDDRDAHAHGSARGFGGMNLSS